MKTDTGTGVFWPVSGLSDLVCKRLWRGVDPADVGTADDVGNVIAVGDVRVDHDRHRVSIRGEQVDLPLKEFEVLALLLRRTGRVVSRQ